MPNNSKQPDSLENIMLLRGLLNKRPKYYPPVLGRPAIRDPLDAIKDENLPPVPRPALFRADTPVIGSPDFAKTVKKVFDLVPERVGRQKNIRQGPNKGVMERIEKGLPHLTRNTDYGFSDTNLDGLYDRRTKDIAINPTLKGRDLMITLAHEIAHSAGYNEGASMRKIEELVNKIYGEQ
jgi:hypothetical protein